MGTQKKMYKYHKYDRSKHYINYNKQVYIQPIYEIFNFVDTQYIKL